MPTSTGPTGGSDFFFSEDSTLKDLQLSGATLTPAFSADNRYYTAIVDHTVHSATVTASPNDAGAAVDIFPALAAQPEETPAEARKFLWKKDTTLSPSTSPPKAERLSPRT